MRVGRGALERDPLLLRDVRLRGLELPSGAGLVGGSLRGVARVGRVDLHSEAGGARLDAERGVALVAARLDDDPDARLAETIGVVASAPRGLGVAVDGLGCLP